MEKKLIPPSVANISAGVRTHLEELPQNKIDAFAADFERQAKKVPIGYILLLLFGAHYAYVGKWGMFVLFWLSGAGCGIWFFVDLFRMSGIIQDYNSELAYKILRDLK
jgi:TM2 domain-containing membrane protein YozV